MSDYLMFFTLDAIAIGALLYYYFKDRKRNAKHQANA